MGDYMPRWALKITVTLADDGRSPGFCESGYCFAEQLPAVLSATCVRFSRVVPVESRVLSIEGTFGAGSGPKFRAARMARPSIDELAQLGADVGRELQGAFEASRLRAAGKAKRRKSEPLTDAVEMLQQGGELLQLVDQLSSVATVTGSDGKLDVSKLDLGAIIGGLSDDDKRLIAGLMSGKTSKEGDQ